MKGVILAGGHGTRLLPLTKVTNKHLLPVYNKPMIYYPLETLMKGGIAQIMIVSGKGHAGHFLELLGSGKEFGVTLSYEVQDEAGGIAQALSLAEDFADGDKIAVILGDNLFEDDDAVGKAIHEYKHQRCTLANGETVGGAKVFLKDVPDAERFGVATIEGRTITKIEEKPKNPESKYAVTGLYLYDSQVFSVIKKLKPSGRGELEITDVNNFYVQQGTMTYSILDGAWTDAGTFPSLLRATMIAAKKEKAL